MKTKENKNLKDKNGNKIKRQVSIITVFLCIFLIAAFVIIININIKDTTALEENEQVEIYEENNEIDDNIQNTYAMTTYHPIIVNFQILILDANLNTGFNFGKKIQKQLICTSPFRHSDTSYTDHYISIADIESAKDELMGELSDDYILKGWSKSASKNPVIYSFDPDRFGMYGPSYNLGDINYIVVQKKADDISNVTLKYYDRGVHYYEETHSKGYKCSAIMCDNTWEGHKFIGWSSSNTSDEILYRVDEIINLDRNMTLYAVWEVSKEETKIKVEKIWEDNNNRHGKRPDNVVLQIKNGEEIVEEMLVSEENNWSYEFVVPKYDENGNEIEYTVDEKETSEFYEKRIEGYRVINKYIGEEEKNENNNEIKKDEENINTSDINILLYVIIAIASVVVIVVISTINKKKIGF